MLAVLAEHTAAPTDELIAKLRDPSQTDAILDQLIAQGISIAQRSMRCSTTRSAPLSSAAAIRPMSTPAR